MSGVTRVSQVVGLKNICYPFEPFYEEYKQNKTINPAYIERAKSVQIPFSVYPLDERNHAPGALPVATSWRIRVLSHGIVSMKETDLLNPRNCIICNQPIEDLQEEDLRIVNGAPAVPSSDKHFETTSYNRCPNPQCLSRTLPSALSRVVYHKKCLPNCSLTDRCGICHVDPPPGRVSSSLLPPEKARVAEGRVEEEKQTKKEEEYRYRRHETRRGDSDDERKGVKRQPVRSTRSPTYHEEDDEDDVKFTVKKRRTSSQRSKAAETAPAEELRFEPISGQAAVERVRELLASLYLRAPSSRVEVTVNEVKGQMKSVVAWFSSFAVQEQVEVVHFFLLLESFLWGAREMIDA